MSVIPVFFSVGAKDANTCLQALQEADTREGADSGQCFDVMLKRQCYVD